MLIILAILLGFGLLIGFHEASHMLVSKLFGVKVNKFAMGFGPVLLHKMIGETDYELRLLPLGGFVQCSGEDPTQNVERGFFSLPWYKRALIALAGPVASLLLGYLIIYGLFLSNGWPLVLALHKAWDMCSFVITTSVSVITGHTPVPAGSGPAVSGPVMVVKILADSLKQSIKQFFLVLSLISLSLGMFNLLPVPALDGGHVFLYILEGIRGKKFSIKVYDLWNKIGMALLLSLMLYTITSDITHLTK